MKPARSPAVAPVLPTCSTSACTSSTTDGSVTTVRTTSTRPMTGAGLNQCRPTTLLGRDVPVASSVTDSAEVLVASTASSASRPSSSANSRALSSMRSGTASMTRSQSLRALRSVPVEMRPRISVTCSSVSLPLATARPVDAARCDWARSRPACSGSMPTTSRPERASTSAMPAPIVPRPTTPTLRELPRHCCSSHRPDCCGRAPRSGPGRQNRVGVDDSMPRSAS